VIIKNVEVGQHCQINKYIVTLDDRLWSLQYGFSLKSIVKSASLITAFE